MDTQSYLLYRTVLLILTVVLARLDTFIAAAASAEGLVTTEDDPAGIEEATEQIDSDQDNEYDSHHYAGDSTRSKAFLSTSSYFGIHYSKRKWTKKIFLFRSKKKADSLLNSHSITTIVRPQHAHSVHVNHTELFVSRKSLRLVCY